MYFYKKHNLHTLCNCEQCARLKQAHDKVNDSNNDNDEILSSVAAMQGAIFKARKELHNLQIHKALHDAAPKPIESYGGPFHEKDLDTSNL
ncbi:hypothetical protein Slin15195_G100810 [Septoria linicola]|uniref:Uncharacterized protein n=1 Tax=Septoria linicola TaxID=215465 RepID=A0A9Q9ENL9_9PEZI|nr:hypothetical protein Slin14017_G063830 [Septoria linicola]USW56762.1 hypothetical protein Slin15195_G100810 [Septoria linicola]